MRSGDVVCMTSLTAVAGHNRFGFKVPKKGQRFVFVLLGIESDEAPLDAGKAIEALGWRRDDEDATIPAPPAAEPAEQQEGAQGG